MTTASAAIIGSTGLVGSHILATLLSDASPIAFSPITTITRRAPKSESPRLNALIDPDTTVWASKLSALSPVPAAAFSALGTTRAQAGGVDAQWKIDHDLNIELARAAKAAGTRTFVFVSSAGTRGMLGASSPYGRMKNGVEDAVKELDFEQAVILKPGMILGQRENSRAFEGLLQGAVRGLGALHAGLRDGVGQEAEVIARAAVHAVQLAGEGKAPSKYWVLNQADIVRLGRTEWPEEKKKEADKADEAAPAVQS